MAVHRRVLVAAHYLPYSSASTSTEASLAEKTSLLEKRRDHASLFSGVQSLSQVEQHYFGVLAPQSRGKTPLKALSPALEDALHQKRCTPIAISEHCHAAFYEGYCKQVLWPIMHYITWDTYLDRQKEACYWDNYVALNKAFADAICDAYQPDDLIWVHDYHLFLLPGLIRAKCPEAKIAFFMHTPFPSSEIFRCLPQRKALLSGLLASDQIGFQTEAYRIHFVSAATRIIGVESNATGVEYQHRHVHLLVCPIGMDIQRIHTQLAQRHVYAQVKKLHDMYSDRHIIFGWDKLDAVNGVLHKLHAFDLFLQLYPEWRAKVVFIQISAPTPEGNPKLERQIAEAVARINGLYGTLSFSPIHYHSSKISEDQYYGLLHAADVGLISPIRDGMNTASVEYVMCQHTKAEVAPGQLLLSEFTGTAASIPEALINPWDYKVFLPY